MIAKRAGVYLFLSVALLLIASLVLTTYVQAFQRGAGSGVRDTRVLNEREARTFFESGPTQPHAARPGGRR